MKILVSGSVAYDQIMDFPGYFKDNILPDKIHVLNVSFYIRRLRESFGGTAGNIAYSLSLLGLRPTILTNVGYDFPVYRQWMRKHTIDTSHITIDKTRKTPVAYIITDKDDNQIAGFYPGAMAVPYRPTSLSIKKESLAIIAPDNIKNYLGLSKIYKTKKVSYVFDPGQQIASLSGSQIKRVTTGAKVFISNDYELSLALKKSGWSMNQLLSKVELVVTTLGARGSVMYQAGKKIKIPPAKPKKNIDPTGAGDAYRAGLLKGLVSGYPLEKTGRLASVVAVYTVERHGTQTHRFTWSEVAARYRQNFKHGL